MLLDPKQYERCGFRQRVPRYRPISQGRNPSANPPERCMNIENLSDGKILYFPTIEFQSDAWLKSALCVWERIYRIVPASYDPLDSDETKEAINAGLIESVKLSSGDLTKTAADFQTFIGKAAEFPAALQGHDNIRLHEDKVDDRILPILKSLAKKIDPSGWLSVSEPVANAYMLFLSRAVAQRRRLAEVTDNEDIFTVFSFFGYEGNFNSWVTNPNASEVAASLVLPNLLPRGIAADSMKRVLEFRQQQTEARVTYRRAVEALAKQLTNVEDREHALDLVKEFESNLIPGRATGGAKSLARLDDYKQSALHVGLPVAVAAMLNNKDGINWGLVGKACGLCLIATMADANKSSRAKWKYSDAYYHLQLHGTFSPNKTSEGPMPRYRRVFHEFMDD